MTAAPFGLRSTDFSAEKPTSSSAHARQAKSSAFQHEFAAHVAESNGKDAEPAEESNPTGSAAKKPTPEYLLRSSLMAQNSRLVELAKTTGQGEHPTKALLGLAQEAGNQTAAVKTSKPGNSRKTEVGVDTGAAKSKASKTASPAEENVAPQGDSAEISQGAPISTESAQAAAQISAGAGRAGAAEKSADKIAGDANDAVGEAADPSTDPQPAAVTGDLSLALKISGESGKTTGEQKALASGFDSAGPASLHGQTREEPDHGGASRDKDTAPLSATEIPETGSFKTETAAQPGTVSTDTAATQMEQASQLEKLRSESVHGVHVQVESATIGKLDLRMVERAGQLSVTVRSTDPAVTRALQEHSSELTTRLALEHYQTELWKPTAPENSNGKSPFQQSPDQNGGTGQRNETNDGRKRKDQNPQWVDEMEQTPLSRKVTTTL